MNTQQTASQLRLAADIIETGHPWEYNTPSEWRKPLVGEEPLWMVNHGWEIRLTLATPPDNRPLHNPDNLTAEQVGAGWRLLAVGEKQTHGYQYWVSEKWYSGGACGEVVNECNNYTTCRLPLSAPWPSFIKPDFQLPLPPPGMQWHRTDGWTAEMLPQGYRPLVFGEVIQTDDETPGVTPSRWQKAKASVGKLVSSTMFWRTTRPLAFTHEGKIWTWHRFNDPMPSAGNRKIEALFNDNSSGINVVARWSWSDFCPLGWRYPETETKPVALGPEDVLPGSVLRLTTWNSNGHVTPSVWRSGVSFALREEIKQYTYEDLKNKNWLINRSIPLTGKWNPDAWEPCHKPAP